ncbi:hypothetical protein [Marinicellulosiphila megalodicopiae]|uniref:hypothetical protein n=1 Tax=Marinicellulosiphila megalodicopiae TaxID=2724896 RepID=UPI003BB10E57
MIKKFILIAILILPVMAHSYVGLSYSAGAGTRGGFFVGMFIIGDWAIETHYWEPNKNINYGLSIKHYNNERMKYIVFDFANKVPKFKNDTTVHHERGLQIGVGQNLFKTTKFEFPVELGVGYLHDWEDKKWETVFYANAGIIY